MQIHHVSLGLIYLHGQGIIHGDLKAVSYFYVTVIFAIFTDVIYFQLNVLIDDAGNAVLCDFDLSHIKSDTSSSIVGANSCSIVGSCNWTAPERLMGRTLKSPSDIYALGMVIFEVGVSPQYIGMTSVTEYFLQVKSHLLQ